ncbi:competence type IV pilus ATPase ComGA [Virgibacillus sp. W0430]|uniref:competence type IV pilus ATPase ComGA n=1 Tax=Virgibacillus sp. W0430 TaxID=3391580 RepID=UPI003F48E28A
MNPAATLSDKLLHSAFLQQASDIHFYPFANKTDIYFRIQGKRIFHQSLPVNHYQILLTYLKFTSGMDIGETRRPQNGTITIEVRSDIIALRLSTLPIKQMESLTIRILPQTKSYSIEQLFLFPSQLIKLRSWIRNQAGIILFTGPTGSGKTTTLYALLQYLLLEDSYQTITLEDPVEKKMDHILQVQVNERAGITYQTGLKAALRHDPDIIMVGEIRDRFTAQFAFEAALTGHLVFSTLHAKDAIGTVYRLLELGISRIELEQSLIGIASMQLVSVQLPNKQTRRAAIMEQLEGDLLKSILYGKSNRLNPCHTFNHLRKKAYAYGFATKNIFN